MVPDSPRPLLTHGLRLWTSVHSAGEVRGDFEPLLILCEMLDERVNLRVTVFTGKSSDGGLYSPYELVAMRAGLRALDQQIVEGLERLGVRTLMPAGASVVADDWTVRLAAVRG